MTYTVLTSTTLEGLVKEVNLYIKNGWKPQGGFSMVVDNATALCVQAMVIDNEGGNTTQASHRHAMPLPQPPASEPAWSE